MKKKILICGMGRAGKDCACEYLAQITGLRNAGTTSKYLAEYVAQKLGVSVEEAYARRHESDEMRVIWYNIGNEIRKNDPSILIRTALEHGEITGGVRDWEEVVRARRDGLVDLVVWIENNRVAVDPTVKFGPEACDLVIQNNGSLEEYHERLERFARFASLGVFPERRVWVVTQEEHNELAVFSDRELAARCREELQKVSEVKLGCFVEYVDDYANWRVMDQWRVAVSIDSGEVVGSSHRKPFLPPRTEEDLDVSLQILAICTPENEVAATACSYISKEAALKNARRVRELVLEDRNRTKNGGLSG